jgi:hypothetical protein
MKAVEWITDDQRIRALRNHYLIHLESKGWTRQQLETYVLTKLVRRDERLAFCHASEAISKINVLAFLRLCACTLAAQHRDPDPRTIEERQKADTLRPPSLSAHLKETIIPPTSVPRLKELFINESNDLSDTEASSTYRLIHRKGATK